MKKSTLQRMSSVRGHGEAQQLGGVGGETTMEILGKRWLKALLSVPSVIFSLLLTCEELGPLPSPRASNARQHYSWCTPTTLSHLSRSWVVRK